MNKAQQKILSGVMLFLYVHCKTAELLKYKADVDSTKMDELIMSIMMIHRSIDGAIWHRTTLHRLTNPFCYFDAQIDSGYPLHEYYQVGDVCPLYGNSTITSLVNADYYSKCSTL